MMKPAGLLLSALVLCVLAPPMVKAQTLTPGTYTTVIPAIPAVTQGYRFFQRIMNVGTTGVAWCSRVTTTPAPNAAGSFPLAPYGNALGEPSVEEFQAPPVANAGFVPKGATTCATADSSATLTAETMP